MLRVVRSLFLSKSLSMEGHMLITFIRTSCPGFTMAMKNLGVSLSQLLNKGSLENEKTVTHLLRI